MKYYTRLKQYKASNLVYDTDSETGYSYNWYQIAKRINGVMYLNTYNYSPSTVKHYYKMIKLFDKLGIEYDTIESPQGLQNLDSAKRHYQNKMEEIKKQLSNPRCRKYLIPFRQEELFVIESKLSLLGG